MTTNAEFSPHNKGMSKLGVLLLVRDWHLEQALSAALAHEGAVRSLGSQDAGTIRAAAQAPDWDVCVADADLVGQILSSVGDRGLVLLTTSNTAIDPLESEQGEGGAARLLLPCSLVHLRETVRRTGRPSNGRGIRAG